MKRVMPEDKHILTKARWIWPNGLMYLYNHYAQFRKDFILTEKPDKKAPFFITADRNYRLYVNGEFVCSGPARGYQSHWPFDEVDLFGYLQKGHNWVSIEAYNPGISNFQYLHKNWAGMLCAAKFGKTVILSDQSWIMRRSPGHHTNTARYSLQMDFQEIFDARLDDHHWITSAKKPEKWDPTLGYQGQPFLEVAFGRPPWDSVEERGIPLLKYDMEYPLEPSYEMQGKSLDDYQGRVNISWGWLDEMKAGEWIPSATKSIVANGWRKFKTKPVKNGRFHAYTMNFKRNFVGTVLFEISGAEGGEIIDINHEQYIPDCKPYYRIHGHGCDVATGNRIIARKGKTEHEFYSILTTGNISVIVRDAAKPLTISLKLRTAVYPFEMRGRFKCGDDMLNLIYESSRHCQKICSLDAYVDTPWREQAQWWGDARVQAKNTFHLDNDARLLKRGIQSIAGQSTAQGLTYGHAPTVADSCILPDFSLTWIMTIWDYYWQTGDISLFIEQWERINEVLGYFDLPTSRHITGLLCHDPRFWYFGDWAELFKGTVPTLLNLYYLQVLQYLTRMLDVADMGKEKKKILTQYNKHHKLVIKHLFDKKENLMFAGLDDKGRPCKDYAIHDQVMAITLDIAASAHKDMLEKKLLPYIRGQNTIGAVPSAFWVTYLFEVLGKFGYGNEVVEFIRHKWAPMTKTFSTWEAYPPEHFDNYGQIGGSTTTHAWTAHPCFHLVNILSGIRQDAVNWEKITIKPTLNAQYGNVTSLVPTPRGDVRVHLKYKGDNAILEVMIPSGVTAEIITPAISDIVKGKRKTYHNLF